MTQSNNNQKLVENMYLTGFSKSEIIYTVTGLNTEEINKIIHDLEFHQTLTKLLKSTVNLETKSFKKSDSTIVEVEIPLNVLKVLTEIANYKQITVSDAVLKLIFKLLFDLANDLERNK